MAERHTVDVDVVGSKPIRLPLFMSVKTGFFAGSPFGKGASRKPIRFPNHPCGEGGSFLKRRLP
jgi:hypothetical protein